VGAISVAIAVPVVAVVFVALLQPASAKPVPSIASGAGPGGPGPGVSMGSMPWNGLIRRWRLFIPPASPTGGKLPVLVLLHPAGGNSDSFVAQTEMDRYAAQYHFMTVAPQGAIDGTWNAGTCCGDARDRNTDDVGFISALLDQVIATTNADPGQIYAAGASNGGMLAYELACQLSTRFQAVFSAGGVQTYDNCNPGEAVSVVEFHSVLDQMVPYNGGVNPIYAQPLTTFQPASEVFKGWSALDHCTSETSTAAGPGETLMLWYGCNDGTLLEIWLRTAGGGHEWPTSPDAPVDASVTIAKAIASKSLLRHPGTPSGNPLSVR
jgi:polyhydroxybutyrate depolymerase